MTIGQYNNAKIVIQDNSSPCEPRDENTGNFGDSSTKKGGEYFKYN